MWAELCAVWNLPSALCAGMCSWPPLTSYLGPHGAGWLAVTRMFPRHMGAACSGTPGQHELAEMQQMPPPPPAPPQVPPPRLGEEPEPRKLLTVARRPNDSDQDGDSMESPQEAHVVTQCMSRASGPGLIRAPCPCALHGLGVWDAAASRAGLGTRDAVPPLPGALRSPPPAGPLAPCPLFLKPKVYSRGFPGDSARGRCPTQGPQH